MVKKIISILISLHYLFSLSSNQILVKAEENLSFVRVAIILNADSIELKINSPYTIFALNNDSILHKDKFLRCTKVYPTDDGIKMGSFNFKINGIKIRSKRDGHIYINNRCFRGEIDIIRKENKKLLVINQLEIEDYVKGVLYHEVFHRWPMEALKAQAVISRTYAFYQIQENKNKDFDVTCDVYSQVYGGRTSEKYRTNKAVNLTKREILMFNNNIFPTYYHATCGGYTEDASSLWKIDIMPLKGVECKYCRFSPHFHWQAILTTKEIQNRLNQDNIIDIIILGRNKSGRITDLKIMTDKGDVKISAKDFRQLLGPNVIRSTNFTVSKTDQNFEFNGFGWGHGVGLCQWGSFFMARQGKNYKQILEFYYPGSQIKEN